MAESSWIAGGVLARLLMIAFLLVSVRALLTNHTGFLYDEEFAQLPSYAYAIAVGIVGLAGSLVQITVSFYLLMCKSKSIMLLNITVSADILISVVLASGVYAGFLATNKILPYAQRAVYPPVREDLFAYYNKAVTAVVFLLVATLLSFCTVVVSSRLRTRKINLQEGV